MRIGNSLWEADTVNKEVKYHLTNLFVILSRTVRFGLRQSRTLRLGGLPMRPRLVGRILQPKAVRSEVQRARPVQKRNVPLRHRLERKTLHDRRMPQQLFRPWPVQV